MSKIKAAIESAKKKNMKRKAAELNVAHSTGTSSASTTEREIESIDEQYVNSDVRNVDIDLGHLRANRILTPDLSHPVEGAYRMLRTRLMQVLRANGWRIVGVTSINPNEGKTFSSINLAISIAAEIGQRAVLVDLDLRNPSIYRSLGVDDDQFTCLTRLLTGNQLSLSSLLVCPSLDRLSCLLTSTPLPRSSDILRSPHGTRLFEDLREQLAPETIVIVDLPPLYGADDALAVAPLLDGMLLVVAEGLTKRSDLAEARQLAEEYNIIGTLLNRSVEKDSKRAYGY